ncbi:MAG: tRNA pseudouridine synthase [Herbinix sp.]|nr:tRNA pseudouridine synthase [Herbinix sp.]
MYNYKISMQYDGGRYKGWQRLGDGENTIQGKIEHVLTEMVGTQIEIIGCSRTDAGVHALMQVANFKLPEKINELEMKQYLNRYLPEDISVHEVIPVTEEFHARYHAKKKTYLYKIWNKEHSNPFMRKYSMHVPKKLNVSQMQQAAMHFIGEHDFTTFTNAKSRKKSMVRTIYSIEIEETGGFIIIRVSGDGFLYNMVRKMVGTLIEVGNGEISQNEIPYILKSKQRDQSGVLADACGLYLEKIEYD